MTEPRPVPADDAGDVPLSVLGVRVELPEQHHVILLVDPPGRTMHLGLFASSFAPHTGGVEELVRQLASHGWEEACRRRHHKICNGHLSGEKKCHRARE